MFIVFFGALILLSNGQRVSNYDKIQLEFKMQEKKCRPNPIDFLLKRIIICFLHVNFCLYNLKSMKIFRALHPFI